ncbi:MAG: right-handed parallel beta-helix repeat-containing protein, partial [bacterium]
KGGGIFCFASSPNLNNCSFSSNQALNSGGGAVYADQSSPNFTGCSFTFNKARFSNSSGGAIYCTNNSAPTFKNCTISNNEASYAGGGIYCANSSSSELLSCIVSTNSASTNAGGGVYCSGSSLSLTNCTLSRNSAPASGGGGIYCTGSSMDLTNCTVSRNSASASGGGIFGSSDSSILLKNSIIWDNSPDAISETCDPVVSYSDIEDEEGAVFPGIGNINEDPLFLYPEKEVYYLQLNSPCIDSGTNEEAPDSDIANEIRPQDGDGDGEYICDMGSCEFSHPRNYDVNLNDSIQDAIDGAHNFDVIIVHPGIYYENINFNGKAITLTSEDPNNQDIVNATVINGINTGNVVTFNHREGKLSVLKGLRLENGSGHGVYCYNNSSPSILNCNINDNKSYGIFCEYYCSPNIQNCNIMINGSYGIYCWDNSSPGIHNCDIVDNNSYGIYCSKSCSPGITECNIMNNHSYGIYCYNSCSPIIQGCDITNNYNIGIYCYNYSSPGISNCVIKNNRSQGINCNWYSSPNILNCDIIDNDSHGIYCYYNSSPNIQTCKVKDNNSHGISCDNNCSPVINKCIITDHPNGSGIWCNKSSPNISNSLIALNSTANGGGIYCANSSSPHISHCTIAYNIAHSGSGIYCDSSSPAVKDSIVWGNFPQDQQIFGNSCNTSVTFSDIQMPGGEVYPGEGNINKDPLLTELTEDFCNDPNSSCMCPSAGSPCIDAGDPNCLVVGDICGKERPQDGDSDGIKICDMGHCEFLLPCCYKDNDGDGYGDPNVTANYVDGNCPAGYIPNAGDCNDTNPHINPVALEIPCNSEDENCDGFVDTINTPLCNDSFLTCMVLDVGEEEFRVSFGINEEIARPISSGSPKIAFKDPNSGEYYDYFLKECDQEPYHWVLYVDANEYYDQESLPILSWEPYRLPPKTGYEWRLVQGEMEDGNILVSNMAQSDSYSIKPDEGGLFSIVRRPGCTHPMTYYRDADGDGYGVDEDTKSLCSPDPNGIYDVTRGGDCNDDDPKINPGAGEICDEIDNNCDDIVDPPGSEGCIDYYRDADRDSCGIDEDTKCLCSPDTDNFYTATQGGDCNDNDDSIKPGAGEICDEIDNNCDDIIDPPGSKGCASYYKDADRDGYGIDEDTKCLCSPDANSFYTATQGGDCDDNDPLINPGALETACNGVDDNCDGYVDMINPPLCNDSFLTCIVLTDGDEEFSVSFGIDEGIKKEISPEQARIAFKGPNPSIFFDYFTKSCGQESYNWILYVNPNEHPASGSYPILSWDPDVLPEREGYEWRLIQGENEINMSQYNSWIIMPDDGEFYSILWLPPDCRPYYRDEDKDGYGLCEDSLYLCTPDPDGIYTAMGCEDCDDTDPYIYPRKISIADIEARPGETYVEVPIEISDAAGLAGGDFVLTYDPNVLIAQEIKVTPLLQEFLVDYSINQNTGEIYLGMASSEGIDSGEGTMMKIVFNVSEDAGEGVIVPLIFEELAFFNENVEDLCGVPINGKFEIVICTKGDVNQDGDITSADAILVLRIAVKKMIPDPYQECAADVNRDGKINSADAILILRAAVKKETLFLLKPDCGMPDTTVKIIGWNFGDEQGGASIYFGDVPADPVSWMNREIITTVPSDVPAGYLDVTVENDRDIPSNPCKFMVNQANARLKAFSHLYNENENPKTISIPNGIIAAPCERITIPVNIDDATDIAGMDFVFTFDPAILRPVITERTDLTNGFSFDSGASENGRFRVSGARGTGIFSGTGSIIDLIFEVSSDAGESGSTKITIDNIRLFDENAYPIRATALQSSEILINAEDFCEEPSAPEPTYQDRHNKYWQFSTPYGYYPSYSYNSLQPFAWTTLLEPSYEMNYFYPNNVFPRALYPVYPSWTENYYNVYTSSWSPQMLNQDIPWDLIW